MVVFLLLEECSPSSGKMTTCLGGMSVFLRRSAFISLIEEVSYSSEVMSTVLYENAYSYGEVPSFLLMEEWVPYIPPDGGVVPSFLLVEECSHSLGRMLTFPWGEWRLRLFNYHITISLPVLYFLVISLNFYVLLILISLSCIFVFFSRVIYFH